METQGKGSVLYLNKRKRQWKHNATAVATQGKSGVLAAEAVPTQGTGCVFYKMALDTQGKGGVSGTDAAQAHKAKALSWPRKLCTIKAKGSVSPKRL